MAYREAFEMQKQESVEVVGTDESVNRWRNEAINQ